MNTINHRLSRHSGRYAFLLALLFCTSVFTSSAEDDRRVDYTGTQEIDISVGTSSVSAVKSVNYFGSALVNMVLIMDPGSPEPVYNGKGGYMLPTFRAEYGYNILSWLNLSGGVNYSYGRWPMVYGDDTYAWDAGAHFINITFNVKFYWLNRKWVRMYSGLGVGIGILNSNIGVTEAAYRTGVLPAIDIRLIGLTVGQKVYGRFEVGTTYGLVTAGIGYRF